MCLAKFAATSVHEHQCNKCIAGNDEYSKTQAICCYNFKMFNRVIVILKYGVEQTDALLSLLC